MPDWFDQYAAQTRPASAPPSSSAGADWFAQYSAPRQPDFRAEVKASDGAVNHAKDFASEVGHALNPVEWAKGLYSMASDLVGTAKGMGAAHERIFREGQRALSNGDYLTASRKFVNYLTPIVGPITDRSADLMAEGKYGQGAGVMVGFGAQMAAPAALSRATSVRVPMAPRNANPAERAAVDFGMREGIPVDAGTATGNLVVRGAQWGAERTVGGSIVAGRARQAQAEGLATVGEHMASRVNQQAVTAEQAGQGVRDAVSVRASGLNAQATTAYDRLRAIEAGQAQRIAQTGGLRAPATSTQAFTNVPLAVDIAPTKAAMQPVYEALKREAELVPLMGDKARALTTLDRLMQAPDMAPLSVADAALSDIKAIARVDQAFKRTTGQGVAAQTVTNLDRAVVTAARQGGRDVLNALMEGRAATVNKYKAIEVFDALRAEPVQVFNQLTANKDSAVSLLRRVQREAPTELPKLGRAYLEGLFEKATAEGGFTRADGVFRDWTNLGTETKALLFRNPALVKDLDSFFLLAKRTSQNPNPSGTAFQVGLGAQGWAFLADPATGIGLQIGGAGLAALLHSPRAVRLMTRGLRLPAGNRAAAATASAELAAIARENGVPLVPATAEREP